MKLLLSVILALLALYTDAAKNLDSYTFEQWVSEYKPEEFLQFGGLSRYFERRKIFEKNMAIIKEHNSRPDKTWTMGVNQYTAYTEEEFAARLGRQHELSLIEMNLKKNFPTALPSNEDVPEEFSWMDKGVVSVLNQGSCGSCWAFAAAGAINGVTRLKYGTNFTVSTQAMTSCTANPYKCGGTGGCQGSTAQQAFFLAFTHGLPSEEVYPYISGKTRKTEDCQLYKPEVRVTGFHNVPNNNAKALMQALMKGPVSVSVAASKLHFYGGGILSGDDCFDTYEDRNGKKTPIGTVNHAVLLVGYGTDKKTGQKYWEIVNSWGEGWGEGGAFRITRDHDETEVVDKDIYSGSACKDLVPPTEIVYKGCLSVLSDSTYIDDVELLN